MRKKGVEKYKKIKNELNINNKSPPKTLPGITEVR